MPYRCRSWKRYFISGLATQSSKLPLRTWLRTIFREVISPKVIREATLAPPWYRTTYGMVYAYRIREGLRPVLKLFPGHYEAFIGGLGMWTRCWMRRVASTQNHSSRDAGLQTVHIYALLIPNTTAGVLKGMNEAITVIP